MSKAKRIEAAFETPFGVVNVGDEVVVTTVCTKYVSQYKGKYLGYILNDYKKKQAQVLLPDSKHEWFYKGTDRKYKWDDGLASEEFREKVEMRKIDFMRVSTLQRNRMIALK